MIAASRLEPQSRLTVVPGTLDGRPASRVAIRATLRFSSPAPFALPNTTSSIRCRRRAPGARSTIARDHVRRQVVGADAGEAAAELAERGPDCFIDEGAHATSLGLDQRYSSGAWSRGRRGLPGVAFSFRGRDACLGGCRYCRWRS